MVLHWAMLWNSRVHLNFCTILALTGRNLVGLTRRFQPALGQAKIGFPHASAISLVASYSWSCTDS